MSGNRQTDRETHRQTERHTDRHTDTQIDRRLILLVNPIHIKPSSLLFSPFREAVDTEGDGDVSKEAFVKNAMQCKFIFNMLKK